MGTTGRGDIVPDTVPGGWERGATNDPDARLLLHQTRRAVVRNTNYQVPWYLVPGTRVHMPLLVHVPNFLPASSQSSPTTICVKSVMIDIYPTSYKQQDHIRRESKGFI